MTITDAKGCSNTASVDVTVNSLPIATISGETTICEGETTILTAAKASSYQWSTGATTRSIEVGAVGIYSVTITDITGCSNTASVEVTINPLPVATISGETAICSGETTILTVNEAASYLWSTGATTQSIEVAEGGEYYVVITDEHGCVSEPTEVVVTVNPLPVITIEGSNIIYGGVSTLLIAKGEADSFVWTRNGVEVGYERVLTVNIAGEYIVTGTNANGCSSTASIEMFDDETEYLLTINYVYEDGSEAAEPYQASLMYNVGYDVESPVINCYTADRLLVSGVMPFDDVTETVIYTENPPVTSEFDAVACDRYVWNDITYYESGDYEQVFDAANGCDSIVILHLTMGDCAQDLVINNSWTWVSSYMNSESMVSEIFEYSNLPWTTTSDILVVQSPADGNNDMLIATPGTNMDFQWDYRRDYQVFSTSEEELIMSIEGTILLSHNTLCQFL